MCGNMEFIFPHYIYKWDLYFRIIYIYIYIWIYISPLYIYMWSLYFRITYPVQHEK